MRRIILGLCCYLILPAAKSDIRLPALVGDNMVLQQQAVVNLWGWASPLKLVEIETSWNNRKYKVKADDSGKWLVRVATPAAGGPYHIRISDGKPVLIRDVLIGEVWICSGQSNMEMPVHGFYGQPVNGGMEEVFEANRYPDIRMFTIPPAPAERPQEDCSGRWQKSSPAAVRDFSAVAYMFGKYLNKILNIPIGLITPNCGATAIESWMTVESIQKIVGIDHQLALTPVSDSRVANPSWLFNGMIAPASNYTSKGFIWYQGESNMRNYFDYDKLMTAMVKLWREKWNNEKMPFYYVQLAAFNYEGAEKITLPLTIEAQYRALKTIPHAGIAATTDLGDAHFIHPPRKKEIALRLASLALRHTYLVDGVLPDAPSIGEIQFEGNKAILRFNHVPDHSPAGIGAIQFMYTPINGFELAGADKKFYPAKAMQEWGKNRMELSAEQVPHPVAVRYAFRNFHDGNVMSTEGQPLVPFRSDNWDDAY